MKSNPWFAIGVASCLCAVSGALVWIDSNPAVAQTGTSKTKPKTGTSTSKSKVASDSKELDSRAKDNLDSFLAESLKLAEDFEKAGKFDEAQDQLRLVNRLKPDLPGLKEKMEKLSEAVFETNEYEQVLDAAETWKQSIQVFRGKPVRVTAIGQVKIVLNAASDAEGLPTKDLRTDMVAGIRCGALMGLVVPAQEAGSSSRPGRGDKLGEPFEIGKSKEFTPKDDGVLFVSLNLPAGHKSTGKLNLQFSGHQKPAPK